MPPINGNAGQGPYPAIIINRSGPPPAGAERDKPMLSELADHYVKKNTQARHVSDLVHRGIMVGGSELMLGIVVEEIGILQNEIREAQKLFYNSAENQILGKLFDHLELALGRIKARAR